MRDTHTHTDRQTDASDLIICPMLCYSNGTDNKYSTENTSTKQGIMQGWIMQLLGVSRPYEFAAVENASSLFKNASKYETAELKPGIRKFPILDFFSHVQIAII